MIEKIIARLREKVKYNSEQAEIWREGSDKDAYFREKKDLYLDRANTYGEAIRIVQEVAKEYDWIPVTERLPEPFQRVLVYDAWDDSMTIEHLQENDSFIDSVVAWMPLPSAPYQKGE